VKRGHGADGAHDGILLYRLLASYTHLRATAGCDWPAKFVHYVRTSRNIQTKESMPCSP
jgi:cobyrinic acid a,c-diamide synthase